MSLEFKGIPEATLEFLRKPFTEKELGWKPQMVIKSKRGDGFCALAIPYVDRDASAKRLSQSGLCWEFDFEIIAQSDSHVVVKGILKVHLDGRTLTFCDIGEAHGGRKDDDSGGWVSPKELRKEGVTDAFKRCVRFLEVGGYLSNCEKVWKSCEVEDPNVQKPKFRRWTQTGDSESAGTETSSSSKGTTTTTVANPLTANQLARIKGDLERIGYGLDQTEKLLLERYGKKKVEELDSRQASNFIDHLKTLPKAA